MVHPEPPVAPGADLPPPPPDVARSPPLKYREWYADAAHNPSPERVAGYLGGYRFAGERDIPTPAQLRDQTVALSERQPMAFLCLTNGPDGTPEVAIIHRILRFVDTPGDDPSGFHDRVLGLLGDIMPHQYPTVEVPGSIFHLVGTPTRLPTVDAMEALIPTWENPNIPLGPYIDTDPDTETCRPRNTQLIPGKYAAIIIHRRRIKPKQAYQEIVGAIRADGALASCADVVVWLRAACTARGGAGAHNTTPSVLQALTPVHLPPEVYQYVTQKVQGDLPGLVAPGVMGPDSAATLVGALRALTRRDGGEEGARGTRDPKTVAEVYKKPIVFSYVFAMLPTWTMWHRCGSGWLMDTKLYVPVVTTTIKQMIVGFQFPGHNADDLGTGCQPFLVSYAGKAHHLQVTAASAVADQLSQGDQNASLADIRTIREGEKIKFPLNVSEVGVTLFRYAVLCQALFQGAGMRHPFVESLWEVANKFKDLEPFVTDKNNELASSRLVTNMYYARIVRAIQVCSHEYLYQVAMHEDDNVAGIEVPKFGALLVELTRGTFPNSTNWMDLPHEYLDPGVTTRASLPAASLASTAPTASVTLSEQLNVSSLTGSTPAVNVRVVNPAPDSEFTAVALRPGSSRPIMREQPPPTNDAGREMCVAWWTRSACYQNCGRVSTHRPFASPAERTRLLTYIRERLTAPTGDVST